MYSENKIKFSTLLQQKYERCLFSGEHHIYFFHYNLYCEKLGFGLYVVLFVWFFCLFFEKNSRITLYSLPSSDANFSHKNNLHFLAGHFTWCLTENCVWPTYSHNLITKAWVIRFFFFPFFQSLF